MPDASGNPYAYVDEVKPGDWLTAADQIPSIPRGTTLQVYMSTGPSPRLCVMGPAGEHALAGSFNDDGTWHGGTSNHGTEFTGWYHSAKGDGEEGEVLPSAVPEGDQSDSVPPVNEGEGTGSSEGAGV